MIDEFIRSLIRKRFDVPAETPVDYKIFPYEYWDSAGMRILIYIDAWAQKVYDSWDDFVEDMERGGND